MTAPTRIAVLSAVLTVVAAAAPAQANLELGKMWTFEKPPVDYLEAEYGFEPSGQWLDSLRLASLRFGAGCSASFVSPHGLIMTNHHCVRSYIAKVSPADADWVVNGFVSPDQQSEVPIPGLTVQQLISMRDITAAMNEGIAPEDDAATIGAKRARNQRKILDDARAQNGNLTPQVVKLHQGAVFQLYSYKIYDDIRLVVAPHLQTSHFGGDPDNFTYPRYAIDFSFCRAYENGEPADTAQNYFRWSTAGPQKGELVFVTGNPGSTDRLKTVAQMEYLRDASYPIVRQLIDNRLSLMRDLASDGSDHNPGLRTDILMYENAQKAYAGYHNGLLDPGLMARKFAAEAEFKQRVGEDPELAARFGDCWQKLEELAAIKTAFEAQRRFHTPGGSKHLARAVALVRAVTEDGDRKDLIETARTAETEMTAYERASFVDHLTRAADWLPPADPYRRSILRGRAPEATAALLDSSAIADTAFVEDLIAQGETAVRTSTDPAVRMAVALVPLIRANEKLTSWIAEQEDALGARIGQALFACYGDDVSPDATFTLRFSDGRVEGFPYNGTLAPFRTTFYGLFGRNVEFGNQHPFDLPKIWLERRDQIDLSRAVDFVSSNDIIGGNSGSPIVNRNLEVVGLIFDGNIEMLANRFVYTDVVPRAVSVHVDAIMEALRKIYDAGRIADELVGKDS